MADSPKDYASEESEEDPFAAGDEDVSLYEPNIDEEADSSDGSVDRIVANRKRRKNPAPKGNVKKKTRRKKMPSNDGSASVVQSTENASTSGPSDGNHSNDTIQ